MRVSPVAHGDEGTPGPPLRVLVASTHTYLPQRVGGVELSTHDLCLELRRAGHEAAVLARIEARGLLGLVNRFRRKLPGGPLFPADRRPGYPVYRGWNPEQGAAEVTERFLPNIVVVHGSAPVPLAQAFLDTGVPTALYLRDVEFDLLGGDIPEDPRLLVLANSRFTATRAQRELGTEAHVLPPIVRPGSYRVASLRERAVFVNPHPWKGVEIAFRLAERRPDIPFLFVESWKLRTDRQQVYTARAAALPNVEWSGPREDMRTIYGRARLMIVPSVWEEAWGRIVTEAQVSGIPVLSSNRGGLPESVGPGGLFVDPDAPVEAWLDALSRIWDDLDQYDRLSRAALEHSRRPEIQPAGILYRFLELASSHAARWGHIDGPSAPDSSGRP